MMPRAALAGGLVALAGVLALLGRRPRFRVTIVPIQWADDLSAKEVHETMVSGLEALGARSLHFKDFGAPIVAAFDSPVLTPGTVWTTGKGAVIARVVESSDVM